MAPGITVVSIVNDEAVQNLGLRVGVGAYTVIKASSVMARIVPRERGEKRPKPAIRWSMAVPAIAHGGHE